LEKLVQVLTAPETPGNLFFLSLSFPHCSSLGGWDFGAAEHPTHFLNMVVLCHRLYTSSKHFIDLVIQRCGGTFSSLGQFLVVFAVIALRSLACSRFVLRSLCVE
jgi:hypothetical protein